MSHGSYPAAPPPARKRRKWPWVVGAIVLLFVIIGIASGGKDSTSSTTSAAAPAATAAATPGAKAAAPVTTEAPAAPAAEGPVKTFGNGTFRVGTDIVPGRYRSPGPEDSIAPICYWDLTNDAGKIIDQGVSNDGPSIATLKKGLLFKSSGCQDWQPA